MSAFTYATICCSIDRWTNITCTLSAHSIWDKIVGYVKNVPNHFYLLWSDEVAQQWTYFPKILLPSKCFWRSKVGNRIRKYLINKRKYISNSKLHFYDLQKFSEFCCFLSAVILYPLNRTLDSWQNMDYFCEILKSVTGSYGMVFI